ncbi:MAG: amino acid adenylation domain-containing protein, partial [Thermoanaerobaculia bacterium]
RTPDVPVAILAAWKAGAAYIPLDPEWPAERLRIVLADAEPALLVHRGPLPAALDVPALDLAEPGAPEDGELPGFRPDRLAYLIYTSGTTGRPKAVMVEHGSVAAMVGAVLDRIGAGTDERRPERVPHLSRYTFDVSLLELFVPLLSGGVCEIVESDEVLDPAGFLDVLERSTRVFTLPALLRRAAAAARDRGPQRFAGLRTLTSGGDLAAPDLLEELLAAFPSTEIEVLYGPTETAIVCTGHRLSRTRRPERSLIGRPLDGVVARVLDPRGQLVPLGAPGELWIGGPGVARGYFRRDDLTAERFVEVDGCRFYRTGDLVRHVASEGGDLEFLGRVDDQVKVRGFRIEPGEIEAALLDHPDVRDVAVVAVSAGGAGGDKQLVAYVVGMDDVEALRSFLRDRLPAYMLPAVFVPLDALPISAHGKVDRKALPAPGAAREAQAGLAAPRNAREELLAGIWREVLGRERVGIHDNFFQLGGDSILSIQIVARARRAGLQLTTRQFFDNQTIALLAETAAVAGVEADVEMEEPVEGEVPLTPIQRLFFAEGRREPWCFNQAVLLASRERMDAARLAAALERLARHHDALRLRFVQEADGWRQFYAPAAPVPLLEVDLPPEALESAMEQLQSGLDLESGPLFTAALFHLGAEDRLLLTAHHLIVDAVSWRVLLEDLVADTLPPKTTSWKRWAKLLAASSSDEEIPYWQAIPSVPPLPVDSPPDPDTEGRMATLTVELSAAETRALLRDAPQAYRTQVNDLLLAALARAFGSWTGERTLLVDLEGHGREEIFPGVDLSRTVGWFTTLFPVALMLPPGGRPRESILAVKETLRAVPRRGLGYGLLRDRLTVPKPQVSFNYLGRFDAPAGPAGEAGPLSFAIEPVRGTGREAVPGRHLFAVDLLVLEDRLRATWTWDPGRHLQATAERLASSFIAELEALVEHCLSPEAGGYSPSDFPLAGLDQAALDRLERGVEDLYPLAPLQEGILFHSLYHPGADPYLEQLTAKLEGPLDARAFAAAWQRVIERHAALRTAFLWQGVDRPLQLVRREAELPWSVQDWRGEAWWEDLLAADRARGFDLSRAPLLRLTLVRTDERGHPSHRLVWTSHHLIFDGWGFPLILSEVFAFYQNPGLRLPPARSYRDFIAWLAQRDDSEAESHWREALRGFTEPIPLPFDHAAGAGDPVDRSVTFPAAELEALAQRLRLSLNTLVQGAWALLLSRYSQAMDVVFGAVVSGRPAELPGVESIVGLFINTVPVRAKIPEDEPASAWLARFQAEQVGLRQYQWTPLSRVQALSEVPPGEPLFASLLAFENYPIDPSVSGHLGELRIVDAELDERTNYPLGLTVVARGGDLSLRLSAHPRFEPATAERLLAHLGNLLQALAADPERPPRDLPMFSEGELRQALADWNHTAGPVPDRTLPERFAAQAARTPDAIAVIAGKEKLTYGEIDRRSDELARRLDVEPDSRVALLLGRTPDVPVAILAAWKTGAAYIPLDPEWPAERLRTVLADAEPALLVHRGPLPVSLDVTALDLAEPGAPGDGELPGFRPDRLAYLIYTSGTTGRPKAVMV